jgi:hypothetical protein
MDPRERADAILARARARGAFVVTPDSAISPMDAAHTVQIPRNVVHAVDAAEATTVFPIQANLPAIAQEAATQSLASPGRPSHAPTERFAPAQPPDRERVEGLLPTTTHTPDRNHLSRRLDGLG